jgi:hypothetical protein
MSPGVYGLVVRSYLKLMGRPCEDVDFSKFHRDELGREVRRQLIRAASGCCLTVTRDLFTRAVNALKFERVEAGVEITLDDFASLGDLNALLGRFGTTALGHVDVPLPAAPLFEEDATAATIRRLIPAAAGCRAEVLSAIARFELTSK